MPQTFLPGSFNAPMDQRVDILGIHVSVTNPDHCMSRLADWISSGQRVHVCVCDVNSLLNAAADPDLAYFYNRSGLTLPDGVPLVWAGRVAGFREIQRVCGPDLMPRALAASPATGWRHFFLGGSEGVAERLVERARSDYPGIQIVGLACPPFRPLTSQETAVLIDQINTSGADIVWVAFGAPKQERWMAEHRDRLNAPVLIGVGAAFNFQVGDLSRAPGWMQTAGLEWFYRFTREPKRLWRRYAFAVPRFCAGIARRPPRPANRSWSPQESDQLQPAKEPAQIPQTHSCTAREPSSHLCPWANQTTQRANTEASTVDSTHVSATKRSHSSGANSATPTIPA